MKILNRALLVLLGFAAFTSCKKDEADEPSTPVPATSDLQMLGSATDGIHTLELYNRSGLLDVGHNALFVRIKDSNGSAAGNATLAWEPMMDMGLHQHSCPYSALSPVANDAGLFEGFVVFNMASSSMGSWELKLSYDTGSGPHEVAMPVTVASSESEFRKKYTSAIGTDGVTYLLAMMEPGKPVNGLNDMVVGLYKRVSDTEFPAVDGYTIRIDPRMPGMGNHGASGNVDLSQGADGFYHGQVGFSMTGYWKVNLMVEDASGTVLCGNPVTTSELESSVHFKVSF